MIISYVVCDTCGTNTPPMPGGEEAILDSAQQEGFMRAGGADGCRSCWEAVLAGEGP